MKIELSTASQLRDRGIIDNMFSMPDKLARLVSIGKSLHRLYENQCNGFADYQGNWDEKASIRADKREGRLTKEAHAIAEELGVHIYLQRDPRGATVYIDNKPISQSDYDRAICLV